MTTSESIKNIATALTLAQAEFNGITKEATNPFFKSKYATLDQIISTVKPTLAKHGLSITQGNEPAENGVIVTTLLMHNSGEWIKSELSMPVVKNDPQGYGSAITYGRRYAYSAILGVATEEDDDGNSASQTKTPPKQGFQKVKRLSPDYTKSDPIMEATKNQTSQPKCPECGATGQFHRPDCSFK